MNQIKSPIKVLYNDPFFVVVFKPHNMVTVGARGSVGVTLLQLVKKKFGGNIFPVHRLDRVTAGLVIFAKGHFAKNALENAFKKRLVKKEYWALVQGNPGFRKKVLEAFLVKKQIHKKKEIHVQTIQEQGEFSKTTFEIIKNIKDNIYLVRAVPETGRFHQIRCHLSHLGLPILGDKLYGSNIFLATQTIALMAVGLDFPKPKGGRCHVNIANDFDTSFYL